MQYKNRNELFFLFLWYYLYLVGDVWGLSAPPPVKRPNAGDLQRCFTPKSILEDVARDVHPGMDPDGSLSSLILVRLSKQLIALDNNSNNNNINDDWRRDDLSWDPLTNVVQTLASARWDSSARSLDAAVEGTKSASVLSRLLPELPMNTWKPLLCQWKDLGDTAMASDLESHQLSGLKWSMDCFQLRSNDSMFCLPDPIEDAFDSLHLPFRIRPAFFQDLDTFNVPNLVQQVDFQVDSIRTTSNQMVKERRKTAWQGDDHVAPFAYSGKSMQRKSWSPLVLDARDCLFEQTGNYYDGCLLNLYPDGGSGMRYHMDPDQGTLWDYETVVVSVGATRKFAFRDIPNKESSQAKKPHVFTLMGGDVTEMVDDCQQRFQHTVKTAEGNDDMAPRASLVFKKTLDVR
jgi:alkylated DNA repair dioxygenase AlkB